MKGPLLPALLFCLAVPAASAQPVPVEVQEGGLVPIRAPRVERLILRNPQGALTVRGWDRPEVHIRFHKRAPSEAMLERLRVQVDIENGQELQVRSGVVVRGELLALPQPDSGIDLAIDAPRRAQLVASTFFGGLTVVGFRSDVDLGSNTGTVQVRDVSGQVRTRTGQGDQRLVGIQGEVSAEGLSGDLDISQVEGPALLAQVVSGRITARDVRAPVVRLHAVLGALLFAAGAGLLPGGRYELRVEEGRVQLLLPPRDLAFSLEAQGSPLASEFRLDPGARQAPDALRGDYRGGGPLLRLTNAHGPVTVQPLR